VAATTLNVFQHTAEQQLKLLVDVSLGAMSLFASLFAIAATAMLIPRDLEDRTLYTILAKPVPRYDYLVGKLVGVLLVIALSLVAMDLVFSVVLYLRQEALIGNEMAAFGDSPELGQQDIARFRERLEARGWRWDIQNAVLAIFFKACVVAGATLLISSVATSSLFTIMVSLVIFFIGHIQAMAREYWLHALEQGVFTKLLVGVVALVFPDFQMFNIVDGVVAGETIPLAAMLRLGGLTGMYLAIYTLVAYLVFSEREL
ncbi:MAG: ABC transporter permease, partial [Verrucomicrobiales bacterium]